MLDALGDRMKLYEKFESDRRLMPRLPALARIDGRSFSNFTRGMVRPYDPRMSECMTATTKALVEATDANCGYTQSDEITLGWYADSPKSQIFFDGRIMKMTSQLAALATLHFNKKFINYFGKETESYLCHNPTFDARVWNVPDRHEAVNCFLWREWDAAKNSVQMLAQQHFSHKELQGKHTDEMQDMLLTQHNLNWNIVPTRFKRGIYVLRRKESRPFHVDEISKLPPNHAARTNPNLTVERSVLVVICLPQLSQISNPIDVLFYGAAPILKGEQANEHQHQ